VVVKVASFDKFGNSRAEVREQGEGEKIKEGEKRKVGGGNIKEGEKRKIVENARVIVPFLRYSYCKYCYDFCFFLMLGMIF